MIDDTMLSGDINDKVIERAFEVSCYVGCPIGVICGEALKAIGDFDFALFVSMLFTLLMCANRVSPKSEASFWAEQTECGAAFTVSFELSGISFKDIYEIEACRCIAERKNILFEVMSDDKLVHVRFSPICREWSYLELKSPSDKK